MISDPATNGIVTILMNCHMHPKQISASIEPSLSFLKSSHVVDTIVPLCILPAAVSAWHVRVDLLETVIQSARFCIDQHPMAFATSNFDPEISHQRFPVIKAITTMPPQNSA